MINCTNDLDGDGIIDQYGIITASNWLIFKYLLGLNGMPSGAYLDSDNYVQLITKSPAAIIPSVLSHGIIQNQLYIIH